MTQMSKTPRSHDWGCAGQMNTRHRHTDHTLGPHQLPLPQNWVCLLVCAKPTDSTKPKTGRGKGLLLLMASEENARDLSQRCGSQSSKIRELLSKKHMYVHEGLEQRRIQARIGAKVGRVQFLVGCSLEGQHHSVLRLAGGPSSCRTQRYIIS